MTTPVRILSVGAAAPAWRLPCSEVSAAWGRKAGRGQAAVCAPDEDVLTISVEAAEHALAAAGLTGDAIDGVWWGTTRPPFAEGPSHAVLAAALRLSSHAGGALCSGSAHAGMEALLAAADAVTAGSARVALVIVADAILPGLGTSFEPRSGAGAAAVILAAHGGFASLGARVTRSRPFLDRYRGDTERETRDFYDPRLFREEMFLPIVTDVARQVAALEPGSWSLPDPDGRLGATVAKKAGATTVTSGTVFAELGDTGAAAALLGALGALDTAGTVALVGYGGGRSTGVLVTADAPVPGAAAVADHITGGTTVTYAEVLRARGQLVPTGESIPMGVPPEAAMFTRGADENLGLLGAKCVECGTISMPPSIHPHCINCGSSKSELVPLARHGVVITYVINHTMPAPFVAPLPIAAIDLDDGCRTMLQVIGDGSTLEIGGEVELVLRRYTYERGVPVYGFKARSLSTAAS